MKNYLISITLTIHSVHCESWRNRGWMEDHGKDQGAAEQMTPVIPPCRAEEGRSGTTLCRHRTLGNGEGWTAPARGRGDETSSSSNLWGGGEKLYKVITWSGGASDAFRRKSQVRVQNSKAAFDPKTRSPKREQTITNSSHFKIKAEPFWWRQTEAKPDPEVSNVVVGVIVCAYWCTVESSEVTFNCNTTCTSPADILYTETVPPPW